MSITAIGYLPIVSRVLYPSQIALTKEGFFITRPLTIILI